jgi:Heterokaryon incompatibility protein (HET)
MKSLLLNIPRRPTCEDVMDVRNVALIKSWIAACDSNEDHLSCRMRTSSSLPTRVLDVRNLADTGEIQLVITKGQRASYIALSYCWPSKSAPTKSPLTTRTKNMWSMLRSIPVSLLTGSQRTCLALAQKLDVNYVWIDGLCVIQGIVFRSCALLHMLLTLCR